jgi:hypothetical protein
MFIMTLYDRSQKRWTFKGPSGPFTTDRNAVVGWESIDVATKAAESMRDFVSLETNIWLETQ